MRQENRITITLIAVVIVFLVCQLPTASFLIFASFHPPRSKREDALYRGIGGLFNLLMSVNAAANFLLYTALSDKYRKYFCSFIFCWRRSGRRGRAGFDNHYEMDTINTSLRLVAISSNPANKLKAKAQLKSRSCTCSRDDDSSDQDD
jgi:hypothetical protein